MKSQLKGLIVGLLVGLTIAIGISVAATDTVSELVTLYNVRNKGITLILDGKEFICTDVTGKRVEPLMHEGTTYVPIRAVANAFGKEVRWDGATKTIYLGVDTEEKNVFKDESVVHYTEMYFPHGDGPSGRKVEVEGKDKYGNIFTTENGYFILNSGSYRTGITLLNGKYKKFVIERVFSSYSHDPEDTASFRIIGDGKILYQSPIFNGLSETFTEQIEIDLTGINEFWMERTGELGLSFHGGYFVK